MRSAFDRPDGTGLTLVVPALTKPEPVEVPLDLSDVPESVNIQGRGFRLERLLIDQERIDLKLVWNQSLGILSLTGWAVVSHGGSVVLLGQPLISG